MSHQELWVLPGSGNKYVHGADSKWRKEHRLYLTTTEQLQDLAKSLNKGLRRETISNLARSYQAIRIGDYCFVPYVKAFNTQLDVEGK